MLTIIQVALGPGKLFWMIHLLFYILVQLIILSNQHIILNYSQKLKDGENIIHLTITKNGICIDSLFVIMIVVLHYYRQLDMIRFLLFAKWISKYRKKTRTV